MSSPEPAAEDYRDAIHARAVQHRRAACELLAKGASVDAAVHALLAIEARIEEGNAFLGDIGTNTEFIG